jgi:cysteine-rich repeat protein
VQGEQRPACILIREHEGRAKPEGARQILAQAPAIAEPIKAGLAKTDEQHSVMERALSDALRFDPSEGRWRDVTDRHKASGLGEACDDGNLVGGDGCSADCRSSEVCGNAIVDAIAGEQRDDGNNLDGDGCQADCSLPASAVCGNFVVDAGEQCDAGGVATVTCDADCTLPVCGDGLLNPLAGEACDPGAVGVSTAACDADCTPPVCGDGFLNPAGGEQCDDGNNVDGDGCRADCLLP